MVEPSVCYRHSAVICLLEEKHCSKLENNYDGMYLEVLLMLHSRGDISYD